MKEDRILTMARSALKLAHIIRYENGCEIIDISLLRTITDDELLKYRNVGKITVKKVQEIRKSIEWVQSTMPWADNSEKGSFQKRSSLFSCGCLNIGNVSLSLWQMPYRCLKRYGEVGCQEWQLPLFFIYLTTSKIYHAKNNKKKTPNNLSTAT